jgi:hypothetical protein
LAFSVATSTENADARGNGVSSSIPPTRIGVLVQRSSDDTFAFRGDRLNGFRFSPNTLEPGRSSQGKIAPFAMLNPSSRTLRRRGLSWLLWLVLLLPVMQVAATGHALSHASLEAGGTGDGKQVPHLPYCDLCLGAAAMSGGALTGEPQFLPGCAARHALPQAESRGISPTFPAHAYFSRAPPHAPH